MLKIAGLQLKELNIIEDSSLDGLNYFGEYPMGFAYTGDNFPSDIRIYLYPIDKTMDTTTAYLIYTHFERKWGKDLSWAKVIPLQIEDR